MKNSEACITNITKPWTGFRQVWGWEFHKTETQIIGHIYTLDYLHKYLTSKASISKRNASGVLYNNHTMHSAKITTSK